jgi:MoxR-like ATPase
MRPIPAPRLGDTHGLLRAINQRDRLRLDEFITEFSIEELFPPGLENALGRTRQFVSFARSAGLLKEDRGVVELTEVGKRYVRSGDESAVFDVSSGQAEWLRRQLFERHMTDSIYHGVAIGLSLYASNPPDFHVSRLDFGRALAHLGRAGWDNENTLESQGERYTTFLRDLELLDDQSRLTEIGTQTKSELTLPVHMSLRDLAGQLNPGGPEAAEAEGEAEWAAAAAEPEPEPEPEPQPAAEEPAAEAPPKVDTGEYEDVAGAQAGRAAATEQSGRPIPPSDIWERAAPDEVTRAYSAISPEQAAAAAVDPSAGEAPASVPPQGAEAPAAEEEVVEEESVPPPAMTSGDPLAAGMTSGDPLGQAPVGVEGPGVESAAPELAEDAPAADAPVPVVEVPAELADVEAAAGVPEAGAADEGVTGQAMAEAEPADADAGDREAMADEAAAAALAAGLSAPPPGAAEREGATLEPGEEAVMEEPVTGEAAEAPAAEEAADMPAAEEAAAAEAPAPEPVVGAPAPAPVGAPPAAAAAAEPTAAEEAAVADAALAETAGEPAPVATATRAPSGFLDLAAVRAAAEGSGLQLPDSVYAGIVAALASGKHVVLTGPAGSGKTMLALAVAKAAVQAGRSEGAALATASPKWTSHDTVGRVGESGFTQGHVLAAAGKKKWLVIDELDRAKLDKAFGDLSSFLGGLPLSLPDGSREITAPKDWRIIATRDSSRGGAAASPALLRRFAEIHLPRPGAAGLEAAIDAAADGDPTAAAAVKRLVADARLAALGAGPFLDAARHAAERNANAPATEDELEREVREAYIDPHLREDD